MKYRKTFREALNDVDKKGKIPPIDKDNAPGVKIAKIRATGGDADKVADLKTKLSKEKDTDTLEKQIVTLTNQIGLLKTQLENERNKMISPIPNPDTGEVPLRTGIAAALLDKKGPRPKSDKKENRKKLKMSLGKSKIVVDPDVPIGQISGGIQTGTGNLH